MTLTIHAACSPGEVRIAVTRDDTLLDFAVWRPGRPDGVGDLHRGRITARVPAMAGAFVALDGADGFLPDTAVAATATAGCILGVRITRAAQGGKGPRLTAMLDAQEDALIGSGSPALVRRGPGPLVRLATLHPDAPVLLDDPALAAMLRPTMGARLILVRDAFDAELSARVDTLADPVVDLPGGASLSIHPTPALTAIDVDAGATTATRGLKSTVQFALNLGIVPMLAAEIRLRNLSGAILVDFAGLPARRREALSPSLANALAEDPLRPRLLGFTRLGLAEIVRPRIHPPLHELLVGPHAAGLTALRQAASDIAANPGRTLALRAAPPILAALQADPIAIGDLARRAGRPILLRADPSLPATAWVLEPANG
ncbi:MAG TPA: ribonuclease E/G [Acetobacteraceae bacterium]|jgi:Ribonuclease G/E|nr:ribonuclease E/G [Acetobacteraceae bacterium]